MLHPPALQPHVTHLAERAMTRHAIAERATARRAGSGPAAGTLPETAALIAARLREHFDPATLPVQQVASRVSSGPVFGWVLAPRGVVVWGGFRVTVGPTWRSWCQG